MKNRQNAAAPSALPACILQALSPELAIPAGEYRALTVYSEVPDDWGAALRIPDDRFAPHLRRGERAVVDEYDLEPVSGEIFVVKIASPSAPAGYVVKLVQLCRKRYDGRHGPTLGWWMHFQLDRRTMALSEGPMTDGISDRILGRVVGVLL